MDELSNIGVQGPAQPVVVLGGSGFIGSRLVSQLLEEDRLVRIGDLRISESFPNITEICDVRERNTLRHCLRDAFAIVNLAAEHRDDVRPLSRYWETNVEGARQVCAAARETGVRRIIFTSSVAVYGFTGAPLDEEGPFAPFNAYGETKLEAEEVYRSWAAEDSSRSLVIVRPTVVFGEGNRGNVYNLLRQIATGKFLMVGSGNNVKSMAYVGNVSAFLAYSLDFGPGIRVFNYVDQPDLTTRELVDHICQILGISKKVRAMPWSLAMAGGHLFDAVARISGRRFPISALRIRKFCENTQFRADRIAQSCFVPPYSLLEGLANTIQFEFGNSSRRNDVTP